MARKALLLASVLLVGLVAWAAPKIGGELVIGLGTDPESLDPNKLSSAPAGMVLTHVAEPLLLMSEDLQVEPLLVESWEFSSDSTVLTLYLRKGVLFHDGTPFNAEAVRINLERFRTATFAFLIPYRLVSLFEVVDDHTLRIHLTQPFAPFIAHLTHNFVAMLSPKQLAELPQGQEVLEPVGTGPFKFETWVRGDYLRIVRNDAYWGDKPYLDSVLFRIIPSDATRLVLLETGQIHAMMRVPPLDAPRVAATRGLEVLNVPSVRTIYIGFNVTKAPFTDVLVRQAFNYAVDKEAIVNEILGGAGGASDAAIMPLIFGYSPQEPYSYDPEKARDLLRQAGIPAGYKIPFIYPTGRYMMDVAIAEAVQAYLLDVGVELQLQTMEWAAYLAFMNKPVAESQHLMYMLGWGCVTLDADYGLYALFHSSQWVPVGSARSYYGNPEVDQLLDDGRLVPDPATRQSIYAAALAQIWDDAPWLFLHYEGQINAQRTVAKDLIHHPREYILANKAWLDQ